jgi:uncharacterized Zn-binding protein involved in type VI secretion
MPGVSRLGDVCTGHGPFPPRSSVGSSPDVYVNGIPVHRQGDGWADHCYKRSCHAGSLAKGSGTVYVNNKQISRIGDPVDCGSSIAKGSSDVFAGG